MNRRGMGEGKLERGSSREREWRGGDRAREEHFILLWILLSVRREEIKSARIFRAWFSFLLCVISGNVVPEAGHCVISLLHKILTTIDLSK